MLTFMSIHDSLRDAVARRWLTRVEPTMPSEPMVRALYASAEVYRLITGPWADAAEEVRCGRLWADFDRFVEGRVVPVALNTPYSHPSKTYLSRLHPAQDEVWEIRSRAPKPSIRVLADLRTRTASWRWVGSSGRSSRDRVRMSFATKCAAAWLPGGAYFPHTIRLPEALSMNTSRKKPFLSEVLNGDKIPLGTLSYFRERFRDRLYDLVMEEFLKQGVESGLTRAAVARRIGRRPEQITRWFGAPGNWTLETVSDLLLAIAKSEPNVTLLSLEGGPVRNYRGQPSLPQRPNEPTSFWSPTSAFEANEKRDSLSACHRALDRGQRPNPGSLAEIQNRGGRHEAACN